MSDVEKMLEESVSDVFLRCQNERHIDNGDISPLDALRLEELIRGLAQHIEKVLEYQKGE